MAVGAAAAVEVTSLQVDHRVACGLLTCSCCRPSR